MIDQPDDGCDTVKGVFEGWDWHVSIRDTTLPSRRWNPNPNPGRRRYSIYIQTNYVYHALYEHCRWINTWVLNRWWYWACVPSKMGFIERWLIEFGNRSSINSFMERQIVTTNFFHLHTVCTWFSDWIAGSTFIMIETLSAAKGKKAEPLSITSCPPDDTYLHYMYTRWTASACAIPNSRQATTRRTHAHRLFKEWLRRVHQIDM